MNMHLVVGLDKLDDNEMTHQTSLSIHVGGLVKAKDIVHHEKKHRKAGGPREAPGRAPEGPFFSYAEFVCLWRRTTDIYVKNLGCGRCPTKFPAETFIPLVVEPNQILNSGIRCELPISKTTLGATNCQY